MNAGPSPIGSVPRLSIDAFLAWSETRDEKYELVEGRSILQPWVRRAHSLIAGNIDFFLQSSLDRDAFAVHQGDFAIPTGPDTVRYADVMVEPRGADLSARTAEEAVLIVEILSESTMDVDFGPKKIEYLKIPSLLCYLLVAQDRRQTWMWERAAEDGWPDGPLVTEKPVVDIRSLGISMPFDTIYHGVATRA